MHELAVAQSMMELVLEKAAHNGASQIKRIDLIVGNLSGVVPDALLFAFDALKNGTIAAGAELAVEETKAMAHCNACGADFEAGQYDFFCQKCGEPVTLKGGDELFVKSIEIE
jgi:hydrogenase nickel incorporation protein HypA/HybF